MRIGFVVDGLAEYESLADVLRKVDTRHTLVTRILRADLQPSAPLGQIALEASKRIRDLVVSRQSQCPTDATPRPVPGEGTWVCLRPAP